MVRIKHKNNSEIFEATCGCCNLTWEYTEDSVHPLYFGKGFDCPNCGEDIIVEEPKLFDFSEGFFHTYAGKSIPIPKLEIQNWIDTIVKNLADSDKEYDYETIQSGDTAVIGMKSKEEITVYVSQNFYEMSKSLNLN